MCTSGSQKNALAADTAFQHMLTANYGTEFAENQNMLNDLTGNLNQIIGAGPNQQGFSPTELAARNSQAINTAAGAAKHLQTAIGENAAVHGSAVPGVQTGATEQNLANAESGVEQNLGNEEANITAQNYDTGRQNYFGAVKAEEAAPSAFEDPTNSAAQGVLSANNETSEQANANQKSSFGSAMLGLGEGLLSDASTVAGGYLGGLGKSGGCWIAAAAYGGWDMPQVGAVRNLIFNKWNHGFGKIVANLYLKYGERIAARVEESRLLKRIFRLLFDVLIDFGY